MFESVLEHFGWVSKYVRAHIYLNRMTFQFYVTYILNILTYRLKQISSLHVKFSLRIGCTDAEGELLPRRVCRAMSNGTQSELRRMYRPWVTGRKKIQLWASVSDGITVNKRALEKAAITHVVELHGRA